MRSSVERRSLLLATPMPDSPAMVSRIDSTCAASRVNGTRTFMLRL
jgi:hypothetical protein